MSFARDAPIYKKEIALKLIGLSGFLGYERAKELFEENKALITGRFSKSFLSEFLKIEELIEEGKRNSALERDKLFPDNDIYIYKCNIGEGGIFASLWDACEKTGSGCIAELSKIYVDQHIIEILELFDENPYEISSENAVLWVREDNMKDFSNPEIIGCMTDNNKKLVIENNKKRFLTPPVRQQKDIEAKNHKRNVICKSK